MGEGTLQQMIKADCKYVAYDQTGYFSKIVLDYLGQSPQLQPFYAHPPSAEGVLAVIKERQQFATNRQVLVDTLTAQYQGLSVAAGLQHNIQQLAGQNTFTVTTAHQPNIFTGPLYFIYKILHTIRLAADLQQQLPGYNFVPVYYMGSEDADLDELGSITIQGKKYEWKTSQTGAVGRMLVDKAFLSLITEMKGQLGVFPFGNEIADLFQTYYTAGITIQQATLGVVNALFGEYGLVVLIPDAAPLKRLFIPVIQRELEEAFSHKVVSATLEQLDKHYKVQAGGRDINLFYLIDDRRERIEVEGGAPGTAGVSYVVKDLKKSWTRTEIVQELEAHPERFSPNVILRGVFQGAVLPDVAFIGGGGELAYWLELKNVFAAAGVPYPVLLLRNSFAFIDRISMDHFLRTGLPVTALFHSMHDQMNEVVTLRSQNQVTLTGELERIKELYHNIGEAATQVDQTLLQHVQALQTQAVKKLETLEKKLMKAEKRKFEEEQRQLQQIHDKVFPGNNLQERVENMAGLYALYGRELIDLLLSHSRGFDQQFGLITAG
jgi:bacillithiol biosynthesis cysteine-adding enzyme BshC